MTMHHCFYVSIFFPSRQRSSPANSLSHTERVRQCRLKSMDRAEKSPPGKKKCRELFMHVPFIFIDKKHEFASRTHSNVLYLIIWIWRRYCSHLSLRPAICRPTRLINEWMNEWIIQLRCLSISMSTMGLTKMYSSLAQPNEWKRILSQI